MDGKGSDCGTLITDKEGCEAGAIEAGSNGTPPTRRRWRRR